MALAFAPLVLLQWAASFVAASTLRTVGTYDTAYYYVVARNFARGRGLTDTVLWEFLGAPDTVARPAGAYWEIGWPLLLGSIMRVTGDSQRTAIWICAALSGLLPLLTALVAHLATKRALVAWVAGLLVVTQIKLLPTNITPDATSSYQLACLGALAAYHAARDRDLSPARLLAAGAALAIPACIRGEGFVVALATLPLLLFTRERPRRENIKTTLLVLAGLALFLAPFTLRNLVVFGAALPPGRSLRFWMTDYSDLYRFLSDPSPSAWWSQGIATLARVRVATLVAHLRPLVSHFPWPVLVLATIGLGAHLRSARARAAAFPLFLALSLLVPTLLVPIVTSPDRYPTNILPVLCILAAIAIVAARDALHAHLISPAQPRSRSHAVDAAVIASSVAACALVFRGEVTAGTYIDILAAYRTTPPSLEAAPSLAPLALGPDDVVLTDDPWRVAAALDVATIMRPLDGERALSALVTRYRPRLLHVTRGSPLRTLVTTPHSPYRRLATTPDATWYQTVTPTRTATGHDLPAPE